MESTKFKINKPKKNLNEDELLHLSKEDLVAIIVKLEAYNKQLKNILEKKINPKSIGEPRKKEQRVFDFSKTFKRHIMIKFLYLGWDMEGYVVQEHTIDTIEHHLFEALHKVCFIENRETSNYNRCGRTDKGVSAFEQVISLDVRSKIKPEEQLTEGYFNNEIKYCLLLNKVLPKNIRAISWMPLITENYSARFDCIGRTYKYYFPRGSLNISAMQESCQYLVGCHDFRNLCKMDVGNGVVNYNRRLDHVNIMLASLNVEGKQEFDMFHLEIKGSAFLWHMIRCIVAIMLLIGRENESPDIFKKLLNVEVYDKKPQYSLASEIPLNLFFCNYKEDQIDKSGCNSKVSTVLLNKWVFDDEGLNDLIVDMQEHWCNESVKTTMIYDMLNVLQNEYQKQFSHQPEIRQQAESLNKDSWKKDYKKLMDRQKCSNLEDRIAHYTNKRRIIKVAENEVETCSPETNDKKQKMV
ncbi:unnamed protein product [Diamesa hyperborea]